MPLCSMEFYQKVTLDRGSKSLKSVTRSFARSFTQLVEGEYGDTLGACRCDER